MSQNTRRSTTRVSATLTSYDKELTKVIVYGKKECHLCENVITELKKLNSDAAMEIVVEDITKDPRLYDRFRNMIPVVSIDGKIKLAGTTLSNPRTLTDNLRRALHS